MATNDIGRVTPIWRGTYSAERAYELNDIVLDAGGSIWWHVSEEITTGTAPAEGEIWAAVIDMQIFGADIRTAIEEAQAAVREAEEARAGVTADTERAETAAQNAETSALNAAESAASVGAQAQAAERSAEAAAGSATGAANSAEAAAGSKSDAEAYAVGKRGGEDVETTDPTFHNNAKYYSEQAESSADAAAQSAEDAQEVLDSIPADYSTLSGEVGNLKESLRIVSNEINYTSTSYGFLDFAFPIIAGHTYTFTNNSASGTIGNIYSFTGSVQHALREGSSLTPGQSFSVTATYNDDNLRVYFSLSGMQLNVKDENTKIAVIEERLNELGDTTKLVPDTTHFVYGGSALVTITVSEDERIRTITRTNGTGSNLGCLIGTIATKYLTDKLVLKINATASGELVGVYLAASSLNWATKLTREDNIKYGVGDNYVVLDVHDVDKDTYPTAYLWVHLPDTDSGCTYKVGYIYDIPIFAEMAMSALGAGTYDGYTWNAVGDSITNQAKYMNVIKSTLKIPFTNYGISSSTIAINNTYLTAQSIVEKVCGLNGNTAYTDADVWTVNGGLNDVLYKSGLGSLVVSGSTFDNTTVYGALQSIVENIMGRRAHPRLILITPTHSVRDTWSKETYGITIDEIRQAMIDVGEYYGVPVIDLWALGGINAYNAQKQTNPTTSDGVHPTDAGAALMAMPICNAIKDILYEV